MTQFPYSQPRRIEFPLILAGAALAIAAWLAFDRLRPGPAHIPIEKREVTPRGELADFEKASVAIFERNAPSVVHITSPGQIFRTRYGLLRRMPEGTGTGFVWDARGYIVTNYHVVQGRREVIVRTQDLRSHDAIVINAAPDQDIAVLKLVDPPDDLEPITVGTSSDLRVGQAVFAIGNPFGLDHTLTSGLISALDRAIESVANTTIRGVIQVDAAINPGNSGGPLLDSAGRLIGMNTAIASPSGASAGIGFAVPVDTINLVVTRLIRGETDLPPDLGARFERYWNLPPVVSEVLPGSGAEQAGLRATRATRRGFVLGDIVLAIDGKEVQSELDIARHLQTKEVGDRVKLTIVRGYPNRRQLDVSVPLVTRRRR